MVRELELIELLCARDERGLAELQRRFGPLMHYIISPILADPREREECLADVCVRIWDTIDRFDPNRGSLRAWISAIARNTAINRARKAKTDQELPEELPDEMADPEQQALRREKIGALYAALQELSAADRALFYRKYYYMQSTAQIAAELGRTERAVEGRLYRLKKQLRSALGGDDLA